MHKKGKVKNLKGNGAFIKTLGKYIRRYKDATRSREDIGMSMILEDHRRLMMLMMI